MVDANAYSLALYVAAFLAGLVDAVVGGGGLIQLPALFSAFPNTAAATLFGTNKLAGLWGTSFAAASFSKRVPLKWGAVAPAALAAFVMAFTGAYTVTHISTDLIRKSLPFVLILIALYTIRKKEFGRVHAPLHKGMRESFWAVVMGGCIGFYDGFFGPGTGSFLVFLFVRFFGFDFLRASAAAKVVNVACNLAALIWFGYSGHVLWQVGLVMAMLNVAGSIVGSHLAISRGTQFIRKIFLFVVFILILKTTKDAFFPH
ncbi:MAG: TSUP family transporter [Burkholderiaceae bacterium]